MTESPATAAKKIRRLEHRQQSRGHEEAQRALNSAQHNMLGSHNVCSTRGLSYCQRRRPKRLQNQSSAEWPMQKQRTVSKAGSAQRPTGHTSHCATRSVVNRSHTTCSTPSTWWRQAKRRQIKSGAGQVTTPAGRIQSAQRTAEHAFAAQTRNPALQS